MLGLMANDIGAVDIGDAFLEIDIRDVLTDSELLHEVGLLNVSSNEWKLY